MGQYETASVDFDGAREIVSKIKTEVDKIVEYVGKGNKAVETALETNNMSTLQNVQGGFKVLESKVREIVDVPDEIIRAIDSYEEMYDNEINGSADAADIFN